MLATDTHDIAEVIEDSTYDILVEVRDSNGLDQTIAVERLEQGMHKAWRLRS